MPSLYVYVKKLYISANVLIMEKPFIYHWTSRLFDAKNTFCTHPSLSHIHRHCNSQHSTDSTVFSKSPSANWEIGINRNYTKSTKNLKIALVLNITISGFTSKSTLFQISNLFKYPFLFSILSKWLPKKQAIVYEDMIEWRKQKRKPNMPIMWSISFCKLIFWDNIFIASKYKQLQKFRI